MKFTYASAFLLAIVQAVPSPKVIHVVHEKREAKLEGWVKRGFVDSDTLLPMRIGMTQSNLDHGHWLISDISNPKSPNYGHYLSTDEVHDLFSPSDETIQAISSWLQGAGVDASRISQSANKQWMQFDANVSEAEALLKTKYHVYEHVETSSAHIACDEYSVPDDIKHHVDYITPGLKLSLAGATPSQSRKQAKRTTRAGTITLDVSNGSNPLNCSELITPKCIRTLYQIPNGTKAAPGNEMGILETDNLRYSQEDLDFYFSTIEPKIPNGTHPELDSVDGGIGVASPGYAAVGEPDLDFELTIPLIWPQKTVLFQEDSPYWESKAVEGIGLGWLNTFFDAIDGSYCNYTAFGETGDDPIDPKYPDHQPNGYNGTLQCGVYKPTNVISISYNEPEDLLPTYYQRRSCNEMMKLGLQGVTIVASSGDFGVGSGRTAPGTNHSCLGADQKIFAPSFPGNCPYVTSVGASALPEGKGPGEAAEIAGFFSGGGFSNIFPTPDWQKETVSNYFKTANKTVQDYPYYETEYENGNFSSNSSISGGDSGVGANGGIYNRAGRGFPDVSAIGESIYLVDDGYHGTSLGTSASTPIFGSILTLINEERIAAGKGPVGFINQVLYQNQDLFTDVTEGNNAGCGTIGFTAEKGWDPITGMGTPLYPKLLELFMSLP